MFDSCRGHIREAVTEAGLIASDSLRRLTDRDRSTGRLLEETETQAGLQRGHCASRLRLLAFRVDAYQDYSARRRAAERDDAESVAQTELLHPLGQATPGGGICRSGL